MRAHAEWKVMTHILRAWLPTRASTRSRISCAALLVKVIARISLGWAWRVPTRWAIRCVSTRVLPELAPARMRSGPSACSTASRWGSLRPSRRDSGVGTVLTQARIEPQAARSELWQAGRMPGLLDQVRASCAAIAADARHVGIELDRLGEVEAGPPPALDPERHYLEGSSEDVIAYLLTLDAINFGSGWFHTLRK